MTSGIVQKLEGEYAIVEVKRQDACGECHACDTVHAAKACTLKCINTVHSKVGDRVELSLENERFLKATYIIYGLPLIGLLGGMGIGFIIAELLGAVNSEILMIMGAVVGMTFTFIIIRSRDKKNKYKKMLPQVIGVKENTSVAK